MDTDYKVNQIRKKIENNHLKDLQSKLNDILSFCESPIEKLMLLQIFNYFQNYEVDEFDKKPFTDIKFMTDVIMVQEEDQFNTRKIKKHRYRYNDSFYYYEKYNGFKVETSTTETAKVSDPKFIKRELEIYPQYDVLTLTGDKRIDIALIIHRRNMETGKVVQTVKIAIECDGYDYHKHPEKFKDDKKRERELKVEGWNDVLRYSGSEIYQIGDNLQETHFNFQQIMNIVLIYVNN